MSDVLFEEKNDFNEIIVKQDFIKITKSNDTKVYYFSKIDYSRSFKTNLNDNYVEVNIYVDNQDVISMIRKENFLKFKEIITPIKRSYENTDFTINEQHELYNPREDDNPSPIYAIVGFFIPICGFIMWCILVNTKPKTAKMAGIACIIGFIINFIIFIYILTD